MQKTRILKKIILPILSSFIILCLFSCTEGITFESNKPIHNTWAKDSIYTFEIERHNLESNYENVFLVLRNNEEYAYNNIYFFMTLELPNGSKQIDTLEYRLANKDGSWTGKGMGNIKENLLLYRENQNFHDTGIYKIHIQHGMRIDTLKGLEDIGLIIQKTQNHE